MQRYISKELVHFVGRKMKPSDQFDLFLKILSEGWITHAPHNPNICGNLTVTEGVFSDNEMYAPEITCFADIPVADLAIHQKKYGSIGMSFSKSFISDSGGAPVTYLPRSSFKRIKDPSALREFIGLGIENYFESVPRAEYFDRMVGECREILDIFLEMNQLGVDIPGDFGNPDLRNRIYDLKRFLDFHIFSYIKFFNQEEAEDHPENYYFEREWRVVGNLKFNIDDVKTVFFPSDYCSVFKKFFPGYYGQIIFTD